MAGRGGGERGIALVTATLVIAISMILVAGLFTVTLDSITTSAQARKSQQAVDVASSGLLTVQARIENYISTNGSLPSQAQLAPWSLPLPLPTVNGAVDPATIVVPVGATAVTNPNAVPTTSQLVYYSTNPPTAASYISTPPYANASSALLTVVGTSTPTGGLGNQTMQELLSVGAGAAASLSDAVFAGTGLTFQNGTVNVTGTNPELYTDDATSASNLPCSNGVNITGNLVVPHYKSGSGNWAITNSCIVKGNLYSEWPLSFSASSWQVTGGLYAASTVAVSNTVNQKSGFLDAGGAATFSGGSTCANTFSGTPNPCKTYDSAAPSTVSGMAQTFPQISWNGVAPAGWEVVTADSCASALSDMQTYSHDPVSGDQGWIISVSGCTTLDFNGANRGFNGMNFTLGNNLMIITTGGITFENSNGAQIKGSYNLYYVVPYSENGTATSCPGGSITISNAPTYHASTDVAFYTPCNFTAQNGLGLTGTIYAGQLAEFNGEGPTLVQATMPMPLTSSTSSGSSVTVVWQRQT